MLSSTALKYRSAVTPSRFATWLAAMPFFVFSFIAFTWWQLAGFILCGAFIAAGCYVQNRVQTSAFDLSFSEAGQLHLYYQDGSDFYGHLVPGCKIFPFVLCLKFASEDGHVEGRELVFFDAIRPSCFRRLSRVIHLSKLG